MTLFIILALLLTVILMVPLLLPLLRPKSVDTTGRQALNVALFQERRDELEQERTEGSISEDQYEAASLELERDLLINADTDEPGTTRPTYKLAVFVGLGLPLLAALLYWQLGAPDFIDPPAAVSQQASSDIEMAALTERLAQRLEQNPGDIKGWLLLARSMQMHQDFAKAAEVYERALQRAGEHPDLLVDYAEMLAMQQGSMQGKATELIERALQIDPNAQGALWLAGAAAFEQEEYATAIVHWQKLQQFLSDDDVEAISMLRENIKAAEEGLAN
ncbi:MAG: c-type cytochrome biogenesis protein CcmI [Thiohalomonadaceae bacterium]